MSKIVLLSILVLSCVPIGIFLIKSESQKLPDVRDNQVQHIEASSTAQCALCAQIQDGESKQQCLRDFMCL